jgi:hypothetical protein
MDYKTIASSLISFAAPQQNFQVNLTTNKAVKPSNNAIAE